VSWDHVVETARMLRQAPERDLVDESLLWLGRGYFSLGDIPSAIQSLRYLVVTGTSETWRQEAQDRLSRLLDQQLKTFSDQQAWVRLLKFHEDQQEAFHVVPLKRERIRSVAQAYDQVKLPSKAMQWYDQLLKEHPDSPFREDIFAQKVILADSQGDASLLREAGEIYLHEYPQGQWRADVSALLGMESLEREDYATAIQELSDVIQQTAGPALTRYALRNRARAYQGAGKRDLALQDLRQVVSVEPAEMADVIRLGDFLFDQGDYAEAEPLYEQVLAAEAPAPLKAWAKYRWGISLDYQGKVSAAKKLLREVRQLETQSPEFENTIRAAAVAVLDEFSLKGKPQARSRNEGS